MNIDINKKNINRKDMNIFSFNFYNKILSYFNMKTALICIAKNEDLYIDEWIKYHIKLGFDYIYVYQNNWRYNGDKSQYNNVHWIEFDGSIKQLEAYLNFIKYQSSTYDWAAFFDVDEFLALKYNYNVKDWLFNFNDYYAVGVNWKFFGDNGLKNVDNYSVINRFTKAEKSLNQHIKTIINLKKCKENNLIDQLEFCDPHSLKQSNSTNFTISTNKIDFIHGPFNKKINNQTAQLNHYFCKTFSEFVNIKVKRGFADQINNSYNINSFNIANKNSNEIEDLIAYNYYNSI